MATLTCGTCGRSWDDEVNPTPAARCLYEYDHVEEVEATSPITLRVNEITPNSALFTFARPGRVEVVVIDGVLHAFAYDGAEVDIDQEPLFAYDGTLPTNHDCEA